MGTKPPAMRRAGAHKFRRLPLLASCSPLPASCCMLPATNFQERTNGNH